MGFIMKMEHIIVSQHIIKMLLIGFGMMVIVGIFHQTKEVSPHIIMGIQYQERYTMWLEVRLMLKLHY